MVSDFYERIIFVSFTASQIKKKKGINIRLVKGKQNDIRLVQK